MAITYQSNLSRKKMRHRGLYSGKPYEVSARVFLPSGTVLATDDILLGVPVGENQRIKEVSIMVVGDADNATVDVGYHQILDANGDPVVVQRMGPFGADDLMFESPTSDPDAYDEDVPLVGYTRGVVAGDQPKLAGPVIIGAKVVTGDTMDTDVEVFIGVMFDGETSTAETLGGEGDLDNSYLLDV